MAGFSADSVGRHRTPVSPRYVERAAIGSLWLWMVCDVNIGD
jgi:hypothetical protein